jgi:hypothetical protein
MGPSDALACEVSTLSRVLYKTRSQHACAKYWQLMDGARRRLGARAGPARRRSARPLLTAAARLLVAQLRRGFFLQLSLLLLASAARLLELTEQDETRDGQGNADSGTAVAREPGVLNSEGSTERAQMLQPQPPQQQQQLLHRPHESDPQQPGRKRAPDAGPASGSPAASGTLVMLAALSAGRYPEAVESPSGRADGAAGDISLDNSSYGDEAARHGPRAASTKPARGKLSTAIHPGGVSGPGPLCPSSSSTAGDDADVSKPGSLKLAAGRLSQPAKTDKAPKSSSKKHKRSAIDDIFGGL